MVWGAFSAKGVSFLVQIHGKMNEAMHKVIYYHMHERIRKKKKRGGMSA